MCRVWDRITEGIGWRIGKGDNLSFCFDKWAPLPNPLIHFCRNLNLSLHERLCYFATSKKTWNLNKLARLLPMDVVNQIQSVRPPNRNGMEDSLCWRSASDGRFTIKAAYRDIEKINGSTSSLLWMRIWRRPVYEKVKSFLWKLAHERIQTNVTTDVNKIIVPRIWPFACNSQDSALNIIRDSYKAKEVWHKLIKHSMSNRFFSLSMLECILWN